MTITQKIEAIEEFIQFRDGLVEPVLIRDALVAFKASLEQRSTAERVVAILEGAEFAGKDEVRNLIAEARSLLRGTS